MNLMQETKTMQISELDSLILWKALEVYKREIEGSICSNRNSSFNENDYERTNWLLAKVIHKSCSLAGTLDEGETVDSIYEEMI